MPRLAARETPYSVHPGVAMVQKWIAELKEKTGRTLEEWIDLVRKEGPPEEKDRRDWLKTEHGFGTNSAWVSWSAPDSGICTMSTTTNGLTGVSNLFDTVLAVYTGNVVSNLAWIASNDDDPAATNYTS